jgi:hypothetical protein
VFPKGRYDDLTDSTTQAIKYIRDNGLLRTDSLISECSNDAARNYTKAKTAWREKARLDAGKEALQSEEMISSLNWGSRTKGATTDD